MSRRRALSEMLEAARSGSKPALEAIYRDLSPAVIGYLRGQRASDPEDLASDVFVAVVQRLPAFEGDEARFRSWVFSIAHRRLMDERRRLARRRDEPVEPTRLGHAGALEGGNVEEEALAGQGEAVAALGRLTEEQRTVVLLRIVADLSVEEVAGILGKAEGAVKALQRRALAALGRILEREGVS